MRFAAVVVLACGCSFQGKGKLDPPPIDGDTTVPIDGVPLDDYVPDVPDACVPGTELCNGMDDDCDSKVDEDFPTVGMGCDGADTDVCIEGTIACSADGTTTECNDATPSTTEICNGLADEDCNGQADCGDSACGSSEFCCTGTGSVLTTRNSCTTDHGSTGSSDKLEVYCCDGTARFCLSGEVCPWRNGCAGAGGTTDTCSNAGLDPSTGAMAELTCDKWHNKSVYKCSATSQISFQ